MENESQKVKPDSGLFAPQSGDDDAEIWLKCSLLGLKTQWVSDIMQFIPKQHDNWWHSKKNKKKQQKTVAKEGHVSIAVEYSQILTDSSAVIIAKSTTKQQLYLWVNYFLVIFQGLI